MLIVGGGWVGLLIAARLKEAGHQGLRIIDGAGDFGGVWYWNRYPGAQCDVQSYLYLPLLEETGYMPRERYSYAPEILGHAQRIGQHFDLYELARFHTWVQEMRWDHAHARWVVTTNRGDRYRARFVTLGTGSASRPRLPGIPGMESFQGRMFHTSRWDYKYTGGDTNGGLDKLGDKRIAVIGTGASAVQVIPHVAAAAQHTYIFQRTPSSISPRGNAPTDPGWSASLEPGWQYKLLREFERVVSGAPAESEVLRSEALLARTAFVNRILEHLPPDQLTPGVIAEIAELSDFSIMETLRHRVDQLVTRREHAELLKPWYSFMCKRPTFHDEYLPAFNRPNVTLIDVSQAKGVESITATGVVANGTEYEVDCIVYASGFEITTDLDKRVGIPVFGIGGESLYDHWRDGMRTMHGIMTHGFPNLFIAGGLFSQTLSPNYTSPLDSQARHIVYIVSALRDRGALSAQPTTEAEATFVAEQREGGSNAFAVQFGGSPESCTPGYYNQEGRPAVQRRDNRLEGYPKGADVYWEKLLNWREAGELEGLDVRV
jgi:cyclohexanone monooxygenase